MKSLAVVILVVALAIIVIFFILGKNSNSGKAIGIIDTRLAKCSSKPNCVCSEYKDDIEHYIEPILLDKNSTIDPGVALKNAINKMGGKIVTESDNYISAIFTSDFFKFVDDLEIRIDTDNQLIHLRSASRVGYSDAGVNKQRVEALRKIILHL